MQSLTVLSARHDRVQVHPSVDQVGLYMSLNVGGCRGRTSTKMPYWFERAQPIAGRLLADGRLSAWIAVSSIANGEALDVNPTATFRGTMMPANRPGLLSRKVLHLPSVEMSQYSTGRGPGRRLCQPFDRILDSLKPLCYHVHPW